ncbi:hypothetical protein [Mameliella alba]|uniref:Uncharacterized protein n=1 Tax=Mameliella alba TaxID=561184 RepID=A0A0B3RGA2_9RHOB|nr:hypothetical protein [Mameliella alba]KHQ50285.1 hypothetical protein OA50_05133 [Mameliella alba]
MTKKSELGPFEPGRAIILQPTPNGGWVVSQQANRLGDTVNMGAFSSANEMLDALEYLRAPDKGAGGGTPAKEGGGATNG